MAGVVVVFDFDKAIIDVDSDNWVVDGLGATELFDSLLPTMPWNTLIDTVMGELHAQGRTLRDVADVLRAAPIDPHVVATIRAAHSLGCDLRVLSDANRFFIETVLDHHGLRGCFSEINTNPSRGQVLDRIRASAAVDGARKRFIYLGDGRGDFCPSLRLARDDFMMPRKGFPVWDLMCENPGLLQAEVHPWSDGKDMEETLLRLISRVLVEESQLLPLDCKLESLPVAVQDGMPMPLVVKN
ncbi:hypothetical protein CFC21_042152 [Triticum aestivum]|uniref:Phosphatase n=2 Tax=Triticum aestivum TaxID=4565 RepID=A0A3B6FQK3_WHEAT|nr:hypothetical protein CFC21_042152 [Triticum aestivum]